LNSAEYFTRFVLTLLSDQDPQAYLGPLSGTGGAPHFNTTSYALQFDPYGSATQTSVGSNGGTTQNPYSFHAGLQDRSTGYIKFGARWYDPATGTWTQQDTYNAPLSPGNANRYLYAGGDPINVADPTGLGVDFFTGLAATIVGGLVGVAVGGLLGPEAGIPAGIATADAVVNGVQDYQNGDLNAVQSTGEYVGNVGNG